MLTERQHKIMRQLKGYSRRDIYGRMIDWARPMDVGGYNGSHHPSTLNQLVKKGLVEKQRRCVSIQGAMGSCRAGFEYKLIGTGTSASS